jgi:hypothetical protein
MVGELKRYQKAALADKFYEPSAIRAGCIQREYPRMARE